jgi:ATP-dependent DNA helicase
MLPKKREYILYAPMTKEQTDLYNTVGDKTADLRKYLEDKVVQRLTGAVDTPLELKKPSPVPPSIKTPRSTRTKKQIDTPQSRAVPLRLRDEEDTKIKSSPKNAFEKMMAPRPRGRPKGSTKRKSLDDLPTSESKSLKSSRNSTPAGSIRSRKSKTRKQYVDAEPSDEDDMSDDEFEQKLAEELAANEDEDEKLGNQEPDEQAKILELASKFQNSIPAEVVPNPSRERNIRKEARQSPHATPSCMQLAA